MKRISKERLITILIILCVLIFAFFILKKQPPVTDQEVAKCVGSKAVLYTQLGCHACEAQKDLFGENYKYLRLVDCWYEREKCSEAVIEYTPTWIINNEKVIGVQTIEKLRELTGC